MYLSNSVTTWLIAAAFSMAEQRLNVIRTRDLLQRIGSQEQENSFSCHINERVYTFKKVDGSLITDAFALSST